MNYLSFWGATEARQLEEVGELDWGFGVEIYFGYWGDETPVWSWME